MRYTLTILQEDYDKLTAQLFPDRTLERAAYLLCNLSTTADETRFLVKEIIPVAQEDIRESSIDRMSIKSRSVMSALKKASLKNQSFIFVHSHPTGFAQFSAQDDKEEKSLFESVYNRLRYDKPHASLVFPDTEKPFGRVWLENGNSHEIELIRVIGRKIKLVYKSADIRFDTETFDRQIRAFGKDMQAVLSRLRVGVVGAGGTGSSVIEQLTRIGVGNILVADGDKLQKSNVNRVYGSGIGDAGKCKTEIVERSVAHIGLNTNIATLPRNITAESVIKEFRSCDVIFGCTDDQYGRSILTKFALSYYIPVFDMGIKIDADEGKFISAHGKVTTLLPGAACLFCRGKITNDGLAAEILASNAPEEARVRQQEGYVAGLGDPAPSVIPFTTAIAAAAVLELLDRLTGFMGEEREVSEIAHLFDRNRISPNNSPLPKEGCFCSNKDTWGKGDITPFLGLNLSN